jgi:pimeloyl-ACP methyl ester carboxylesterase
LELALNERRIALVASSLAAIFILLTPKLAVSRDALVAVGNEKLHIETLGTSGPTVVFEAGLGNDSTTWKLVAGPISTFARVALYDRPGLGQLTIERQERRGYCG